MGRYGGGRGRHRHPFPYHLRVAQSQGTQTVPLPGAAQEPVPAVLASVRPAGVVRGVLRAGRPGAGRAGDSVNAPERDHARADPRLLLPGMSDRPSASGKAVARTWRATRKHVRNDAGTRKAESVTCRFMGQSVGDTRMRRSCRLLRSRAPRQGPRTCVLTRTWPCPPGRSHV